MFTNALTAVATMLILMGVGCFFAWKGYLAEEGNRLLSALVVRAALPGTILSTMLTTFTRGELLGSAYLLIVPVSNMLIWAFAARWFAKLIRVPEKRQGVFTALCAFSNTVFIGFPVVRAVIGEIGIPYATAYYLANTTMFWVVGVGEIQRDGTNQPTIAAGFGQVVVTTLKRLVSPPFVTLMISIILVLIGATLPAPIMNAASSIGGLVTPLSMIFIGSMLFNALRGGFKWERGFGALLLVRYMLAPTLTLASCLLLGVRGLPAQVFVLQTGMATMTQVAIIAHGYGADGEYASLGVAVSTISLMIALPLIALALPLI
ncbi:MAG: AEC family transporter [Oscillospiraceae bacterium]|jgi:predicted permease|nr:AEC family transporter [Oscillospiraceae bacterium]